MIRKSSIAAVLLLTACIQCSAQFFSGLGTNPANGVYTLKLQPANFINTSHRWQVVFPAVDFTYRSSILGSNGNVVNNAYSFDAQRLFDFDSKSSQLFTNVVLPAVTYVPNERHAFGFSLNLRAYALSEANQSNIDVFLEEIINRGRVPETFSISGGYAKAFINTWMEAKFNYARLVYSEDKHKVSAGAAIKFLGGAASGLLEFANLQVEGGITRIDNMSAEFKLAYNAELDELVESNSLKINLFDRSSIGLDLGVNYYYFDSPDDAAQNKYRLAVGINVIDVGSIKYIPSVNSASYLLNGSGISFDFLSEVNSVDNFLDSLENQFDFTSTQENSYRLSLPTRYTLAVDYRLTNALSVSAIPSYWPATNNIFLRESSFFNALVTPRYTRKRLTIYAPFYVSNRVKNTYGLSIQYGFFALGSSNFWNRTLGGEEDTFNLFLSMAFRFGRKRI